MAVGGDGGRSMVMLVLVTLQRLKQSVVLVLVTCLLLLCRCSSIDAKKHAKQLEACDKPEYERPSSFMWKTQSDPPSFFFGTIHVPYSRVWDYVPDNVKRAFEASDSVFFELDLTDPYTIAALTSCQLLPHGQSLADILPSDLYRRLKRHLEYVKVVMPSWMSADQRGRGMYADYLFNAITGNWERKRPVWVMLMVNSLTESDVKSRGVPVLDLYLAQEAERRNKRTGAVERVEEQCVPLNGLNFTQVVFALNQTLHHQESLRSGEQPAPFTTDDLIRHYNCGNLDAVMFNQDAAQVPSISNVTLAPYEQMMAKTIDDYFRRELIFKRNQRMGERVLELLKSHPNESFFFAFGAGHFLGSHTVLDVVSQAGYALDHVTPHQRLRHKKKKRISAVPAVLVPEPSVIRDFSLSSNNLDSKDDFFSHYLSRLAAAKPALTTKALGLLPTQARSSTPQWNGARHRDKQPTQAGPTAASRKHHNFNDLWVRLESINNHNNDDNNENDNNEDSNYHPRNVGIPPESLAEDSAKIETSLKVWYGLPVSNGGGVVALVSDGCQGLFIVVASVLRYLLL